MTPFTTVNDYIKSFPKEIQILLEKLRAVILENAPDAVESISYGMPAYKTFGKPLVYFAAYKNHIGFYATPTGHSEFANELSKYKQGKGSVQFPLDAVPFELVEKMVQFRVVANEEKSNKQLPH
ncbi:iron chaperone [Flavobacterium macacae]|uniref:DUF1801 domain-containing protein n=1 Tax=Flavobacterium macacae TaxID=2488993 RepID=A0A3P3WI15_9FLAO|nr:DUF1801 domain-containing protein [Flavobacterium macacae]RRJ93599.1 DUF1801 domain-containing protein [Flavobacterium macacae]